MLALQANEIRCAPRPPGFASWCCIFFSLPAEARRAGDRLGVLPGGAPAPLGAFSGKWARGRGASIGLNCSFALRITDYRLSLSLGMSMGMDIRHNIHISYKLLSNEQEQD